MSMRAGLLGDYPIPDETIRVARAAFPKGNLYLRVRDQFGMIYQNHQFAHLFAAVGRPALAPARLALVTVMQFMDGLSDRQAAEAVRDRISWKYALGLALDDPGFDASVLSEFRTRLLGDDPVQLLFETVLDQFREAGLVRAHGQMRTDSTHICQAVRSLNRLESVGEALRHALNTLASVAPGWLHQWVPDAWIERYARRFDNYRLPKEETRRAALAAQIGQDGAMLLDAIRRDPALHWMAHIPAVEMLRQMWVQQFSMANGQIVWRDRADLPPAPALIQTPHEPTARYSKKRQMTWTGYKLHMTETCDRDQPGIIVNVETTAAPTTDYEMVDAIHTHLAKRDLLPATHLVDSGYVSAQHIINQATTYGVDLVGAVLPENSWQARSADGLGISHFTIDWERRKARCPEGHESRKWHEQPDQVGTPTVYIKFHPPTCRVCPLRARCVKSETLPRSLAIRSQAAFETLQTARERQQSDQFQQQMGERAGVEGVFNQGNRRCDLRHARYIGHAKVHLQHLISATALNLVRVGAWLAETPRATTRRSPFVQLMRGMG
jgi:transposase